MSMDMVIVDTHYCLSYTSRLFCFKPSGLSSREGEEEEILFCHNSSTIKHNYRNSIHGRMPEKAHAHQGWPPMVINNAQYKIISESPPTGKLFIIVFAVY